LTNPGLDDRFEEEDDNDAQSDFSVVRRSKSLHGHRRLSLSLGFDRESRDCVLLELLLPPSREDCDCHNDRHHDEDVPPLSTLRCRCRSS
jgi:hypothetical protein